MQSETTFPAYVAADAVTTVSTAATLPSTGFDGAPLGFAALLLSMPVWRRLRGRRCIGVPANGIRS